MSETLVQKQVRLVLEQQCRELVEHLKPKVPAGVGFLLFLADYGEKGNTAYVATVPRDSAIELVREWLDVQGANHPAEGWDAFAHFVTECAQLLSDFGCEADPKQVLDRIRDLAAQS